MILAHQDLCEEDYIAVSYRCLVSNDPPQKGNPTLSRSPLSPSLLGSDKRGSLSGAPSSIRLKTQSIDFFGLEIVMPLLSCSCGSSAAAKGREIGCRLQRCRVGQEL